MPAGHGGRQRKPRINTGCLSFAQNNFLPRANCRTDHENRYAPDHRHRLALDRRRRPRRLRRRNEVPDDGQDRRSAGTPRDRPRRQRHPALPQPRARLCHQHPLRARDGRSGAAHRARQAAQADRRRPRQDERAAQGAARPVRRRRHHRQQHRRDQFEIHRAPRGHRQGDRRTCGCPQGRGQKGRRRQCRAQLRRHRAAQRAGPPHGDPQRGRLPPVQLRQHRHDAARHRRPQFQRAQEPRRREESGQRRREGRHGPHAGPQRPDRDVADGIAWQSGNSG